MAPITLYHFPPSAHSRGALWVIRYLGLEVDVKIVNLFEKEQLHADFVQINPQHCVPTLVDDAFVLWESRAIGTYLVDAKAPGHSLYPVDVQRRARINQRLNFDLGTLYTRIRAICFPIIYLGETKIPDDKRASLVQAFELLNQFLEGGAWLAGGDEPSVADIFAAASISSVIHAGASVAAYPNIAVWFERCRALRGFDENEEGARKFGARIAEKLVDKF